MNGRLNTLEEGIRIALSAIVANKIRAGLTILGVAIGVAVVVTMAAMITGIRTSIVEGFESSGPDNFIVTRFDMTDVRIVSDGSGRPPWWNHPKITPLEVERLGRLPTIHEAVVDFDLNVNLSYEGDRVTGIPSKGTSEGWEAYNRVDFVAGRNFIQMEVDQGRPVTVITVALAEALFGQLDPVGKRVRVTTGRRGVNELFTVVGVIDFGDQPFAEFFDHMAFFPHTSARKRLKANDWMMAVLLVPDSTFPPVVARDQVISTMRSLRGLGPREENNFAVIQSTQLLELFDQLTGAFFMVMIALSSVGLLVGGVGVVGIMLISVTERTREIGVRKAVGATRQEILWQFLVEAGVLTLVGGALGMLIGGLGAEAIEAVTPIPAKIPLWSIAVAMTAALLTGMLFGLLPAVRASRMEPVTALRFE